MRQEVKYFTSIQYHPWNTCLTILNHQQRRFEWLRHDIVGREGEKLRQA